ncbi:hypothetical protein FB381_0560 [Nocardioides albertanoniae]|uniref:Uncharacterized protein n=1 Tax=Nocardioides albertanoniae TaxID=1175486 RepID=A0A543A2L4_9ACTN|nr:hypothetical protein [Nocardioides albertanoniae]TQL66696.1 hypothetical protein FB381_0560 [Nocardioides albertanoniae]
MRLGRNEPRTADVPKDMTPTDISKPTIRRAAYALPVLALTLLPAIAGCGSEATDPGANVSDVPTSSSPTPEDPNVAEAIADLSKRQGVKSEEITVVSNDKVTWRDGSLGCPEPGKMYTMALTEGVRVVLETAGKQFEYHGGKSGSVVFCEKPQKPVPDKGSSQGNGNSDAPQ